MTDDASVQSGNLTIGNNQVQCLRMGGGKKLLIAFPGFGNEASMFKILAPFIQDAYTLVAINLPGQGQTSWKDKYLKPEQLMSLVQSIKQDFGATKISLAGHSLGARAALQVAALQPGWIERLVLLAPDGMKKNWWYYLATRNIIGKWMFQKILARPEKWLPLFSFLNRLGMVSDSHFQLAKKKLSDKNTIREIAYVWPVMSRLTPLPSRIKWNLNKYRIKTHIFMGRRDRIFPVKEGESFKKDLEAAQLHLLHCGHHMLTPACLPEIAAALHHSS